MRFCKAHVLAYAEILPRWGLFNQRAELMLCLQMNNIEDKWFSTETLGEICSDGKLAAEKCLDLFAIKSRNISAFPICVICHLVIEGMYGFPQGTYVYR
jgi:hypothetical protein